MYVILLLTKTAGNRIKTACIKMKRLALLLVVFLGIGVAAQAQANSKQTSKNEAIQARANTPQNNKVQNNKFQSCQIAKDGTRISVEAQIAPNTDFVTCVAKLDGKTIPQSGTVKVKVYYITMDNKEDFEVMEMKFDKIDKGVLQNSTTKDGKFVSKTKKIKRISKYEVVAEDCKF